MRFTREGKKRTARTQKQIEYKGDFWSGRRVAVGQRCNERGNERGRRISLDDLEVEHIRPSSWWS